MNKSLSVFYILLVFFIGSTSFLEAQKQKATTNTITKESFKNLNKIPFEVTRIRVNSTMKVTEIKGWSPENYDCSKKSIYDGFLGCTGDESIAKISGSGFGDPQGNGFINCSEPKIKVLITGWNDNEINLNVLTIDPFLETRKVTLTISNNDGEQVGISIDVIGVVKVKNADNSESFYAFGQSMWAVAKHRKNNELPIPESPTTSTAKIDVNYEPMLWDCIIFNNNRMGVLIKVSPKKTETIDEEEEHTWSVILEEMNTKCSEKRSVVICKFQLGNTDYEGYSYELGITLNIGSSEPGNVKAVAYYR